MKLTAIFNRAKSNSITELLMTLNVFHSEYKHKVNLKDHKEDDTLSYNPKITWFFNPSKSAPGLTGNELITIPHPLILVSRTTKLVYFFSFNRGLLLFINNRYLNC